MAGVVAAETVAGVALYIIGTFVLRVGKGRWGETEEEWGSGGGGGGEHR